MYIRPVTIKRGRKRHAYWALVESYRTERGPRQRVVAYLGQMDPQGRLGVKHAAQGQGARRYQRDLWEKTEPEWVEVDVKGIRVENARAFGGVWLGLELMDRLGLRGFLDEHLPWEREEVPPSLMAATLVLARLCEPSSELHIAEHFYRHSALSDLLGVPQGRVNEDRLYRTLDALWPHKEALEVFLKERLGTLFKLEYDLLLYDVTSTYFEGQAKRNPLARHGYSRDHRPDCLQVCIALVVSKNGMPIGYEVFEGNRSDMKTLQPVVTVMEERYGKPARIWVVDRGMASEENVTFLREGGRRYIVGTPKAMLKRFERDLMAKEWPVVREGLEVKLCPSPDGEETFILCRSRERREKEKAMHDRFEKRIEEGLAAVQAQCEAKRCDPVVVAQRVGRLLGANTRGAGAFKVEIGTVPDGRAKVTWKKEEAWRAWARLSEGCYMLRSNITDWTPQELWKAYIQLTDAEAAFRIQKSDLVLRPIWHQKEERVKAHILVCFLAYVLWKMLHLTCEQAGLGDEPRRILDELSKLQVVDVVLPTKKGTLLRKRCVSRPDEHQAILLQRLGLNLPAHLGTTKCSGNF